MTDKRQMHILDEPLIGVIRYEYFRSRTVHFCALRNMFWFVVRLARQSYFLIVQREMSCFVVNLSSQTYILIIQRDLADSLLCSPVLIGAISLSL